MRIYAGLALAAVICSGAGAQPQAPHGGKGKPVAAKAAGPGGKVPAAGSQAAAAKPAAAGPGAATAKPATAASQAGAAPAKAAAGSPKAGAAAAVPGVPAPMALSVAMAPGAARDAMRRLLLRPYADATGTALGEVAWDGASLDALQAAPPDLVLVSGGQLLTGCKSGALARLDWGVLGRDHYLPLAVSDCGVGAAVSAMALAWDRDKLAQGHEAAPATLPTWQDFWDVARRPGGRGMQKDVRGNLEIALLADGVSPGDVYRTLRTADGLDRAFRKLDQLKPYIIWWDKPEQPAQMLAAGRVLMTVAPTAPLLQAADAGHHAFGLQWAGSLTELQSWAVPAGAPHQEAAAAALLIAGDIARQADMARAVGLGPTAREAVALLPAAVRAGSPSAPANMQSVLAVDEGFWAENRDKLAARFAAWVAK